MRDWEKLLAPKRRKDKEKGSEKVPHIKDEPRTEIERDYDRILFSTPVRRLADKTQVFPLERNDSVRTRLTHSHEVSNLCRSIAVNLAFNHNYPDDSANAKRNLPAMLAAVGLAHDIGNPPFGHQGEQAIRNWMKKNSAYLDFDDAEMRQDFLAFEGNAQTFRLLTRLQIINDKYGLNLTYGTLAALMKYTVSSDCINKDHVASKKFGFFFSEKEIAQDVFRHTGISECVRHPLAYIMEACDDIAYSVLDAEDTVKKGLASFSDLIAYLRHHTNDKLLNEKVIGPSATDHEDYRKNYSLTPSELNDITMQKFRVYAMAYMVNAVVDAFLNNKDKLEVGMLKEPLIKVSCVYDFCETLKRFDKEHAYKHRSVLEVELQGFNTISELMDMIWVGIHDRKDPDNLSSDRSTPFAAYVYSRISENYRRVFEDNDTNTLPIRYKELQLLTDMISGMTDSFAVALHAELKGYERRDSSK